MAAGRYYTISFSNVSISAVQDLFYVAATASMAFELCEFSLSADAAVTLAQLRVSIKYLPATVTAGSVGSSGTVVPMAASDHAATITGRTNDTTRATSSGTILTMFSVSANELNGYQFLPPPEYRPVFGPSTALVCGLEVAPGSATVFDGYVVLHELF